MTIRIMIRRWGLETAALGLALMLPIAAGAQSPADWQKVEAAAKQEGKVVVYMGSGNLNVRQTLEAFEKSTGIQVERLELAPTAMRERIRTETSSGRRLGDVIITGATIRNLIGTGQVMQHGPLPNAAKLKPPLRDDGYFIPTALTTFGILVNTDLVKPEDMPKSWNDLLDPKWKGKMLIDDPRVNGQGSYVLGVLLEKLGRGYIDKLAEQKLEISSQMTLALRRVAQGEYPIYIALQFANLLTLKDLPVKGVALSEGAPWTERVAGMIAGSPNPKAANVLLNYHLSDEWQKESVRQGNQSVTGQGADLVPPELRGLTDAKLLGDLDIPANDKAVAIFREVFK